MLNPQSKTLIPFLMAGYPDMQTSESLIAAVLDEGVTAIELGVPFSDPLADGPTIQRASAKALENRTTLTMVLQMVTRLRKAYPSVSIILFTYLNPLLKYGLDSYVDAAVRSGVGATLTVDLPPEEADAYLQAHRRAGLKTVFLASPTTEPKRLALIANSSSAFIYYVSRIGVTGAQSSLSDSLASELKMLRSCTTKSIAVGFGISTPTQVKQASASADAAVVGSHLLNLIESSATKDLARANICSFVRDSLKLMQSSHAP